MHATRYVPLSAPAPAPRPRFHDAAEPRPHGLHAHAASRIGRADFERMAAFYAERARGGVGLIVTGGIAPNDEGSVDPGGAGSPAPSGWPSTASITDAVHARGRQDRAADPARGPLRLPPAAGRAVSALQSPITPFTPRALTDAERRAHDRRLRRAARARPRGRLRRRRDHGLGGLPHQPVHRRRAPTTATTAGAARREPACASPSRSCAACARRSGRDFIIIYRLSMLDLVEGGCTLGRGRRARAGPSRRPAPTIINTGIGWHEARIPDHRHVGAARARSRGSRRGGCKGAVRDPARRHATASTPPRSPRRSSRAATPTWCRWRGRCSPTPSSSTRPREGRADEINTCIACNQACLDHIFTERVGDLPGQPARLPRDRARRRPAPGAQARRRRRRRPGRPRLRRHRGRARPRASTLFEAAGEIGGQFNLARKVPGKEEFDETLRYFRRRIERARRRRCGSARRPTPTTLAAGGFDEVVVATGVIAAHARRSPGIDHPEVVELPRRPRRRAHGRADASRSSARAASASTSPSSSPRRRRRSAADPATHFRAEWGVDTANRRPGRAAARSRPAPRPRRS